MSFEVIFLGKNEVAKKELEAEITSLLKQLLAQIPAEAPASPSPETPTETSYPEDQDYSADYYDPSEDFDFSDENGDQVVVQRFEKYLVLDGVDTDVELWADTQIGPDEIDVFRADFPEESYRTVTVTNTQPYDEDDFVDFDSSEPAFLTSEDEIDSLKERIVELEALLINAGVAH